MKHLAVIADGNRRWARQHNLPVELGYQQGLNVIERTCEWAIENEVAFLSFYCFSTENWQRPQEEIDAIFQLADTYFGYQVPWYVERKIRVIFAGRRDRFKESFVEKIKKAEKATECGNRLTLIIYVDYGGRDEIVRAIANGACTEQEINTALTVFSPNPDAILRTGGDKRLSNFMLWQAAYAELFFLDAHFQELDYNLLDEVKKDYKKRKRNFGK